MDELNRMIKDIPQLLCDTIDLRNAIELKFGVDISNTIDSDNIHNRKFVLDGGVWTGSLTDLCHAIDEAVLEKYFGEVWQPETKKYKYSGLGIIDQVNALNPEAVLDVGCGYNEFKGKIQNLTGIDPFNQKADIMVHTTSYFSETLYDVVICLGSINFGSTMKIIKEIQKVVSLTKKGGIIIFRCNPGITHKNKYAQWIDFFDWDIPFIFNVANATNCKVIECHTDQSTDKKNELKNGERFYFVLEKLD